MLLLSSAVFFKINFFKKLFQEYHQSVEQCVSDSFRANQIVRSQQYLHPPPFPSKKAGIIMWAKTLCGPKHVIFVLITQTGIAKPQRHLCSLARAFISGKHKEGM